MQSKNQILANAAVLTGLSIALSFVILYEMPMGGSVTLACMLPIVFVSLRYGCAWGLGAGFVMSLFQILQAVMHGNVFPYCETLGTVVLCALLDYIVPFTVIGLAGAFRKVKTKRLEDLGAYIGIVFVFVLRFLSHFIVGTVIWGQWAPEGMGKYLYSFLYNGGFLLPELVITMVLAVILLRAPSVKKYFGEGK